MGEDRLGEQGSQCELGGVCSLFPPCVAVALVRMPHRLWLGSCRSRKSPRTEGLTQTEVIPGLGEGDWGSQANNQLDSVSCPPRVRETAFAGGGGPCSLAVFNLAPRFTQDNIFIFHITLGSGKKETLHTAPAQFSAQLLAQLSCGDEAGLPRPITLILKQLGFIQGLLCRTCYSTALKAFSSFNEGRILLGRNHNLFHFINKDLGLRG